jgi:hypothetical protein
MIIFSGIPPELDSGTGRLILELLQQIKLTEELDVQLIWKKNFYRGLKSNLKKLKFLTIIKNLFSYSIWYFDYKTSIYKKLITEDNLILLHPQTIGFDLCIELVTKRRKPTFLYLLDSSFFCIRSYNHIPGENKSCLRCLGGDFINIDKFNCEVSPVKQSQPINYLESLKKLVSNGKIKLIAQNLKQAEIASAHFNITNIPVVGLWTIDFSNLFFNELDNHINELKYKENENNDANFDHDHYDIVFHGNSNSSKGAMWVLELAKYCPEISFFFPFKKHYIDTVNKTIPKNCFFESMTWENGLQEKVSDCKLVLLPSLWSAPIEGALIKSIAIGQYVAVVDDQTNSCYSSELPDDLVLKLPCDLQDASYIINQIIKKQPNINEHSRSKWLKDFRENNINLLVKLIDIVNGNVNKYLN